MGTSIYVMFVLVCLVALGEACWFGCVGSVFWGAQVRKEDLSVGGVGMRVYVEGTEKGGGVDLTSLDC